MCNRNFRNIIARPVWLACVTFVFVPAGLHTQILPSHYRISVLAGDTRHPETVRARAAYLNGPGPVAVASDGTIYFDEGLSFVIRKISPDGMLSTTAGTASMGHSGDGGPATAAQIGADIVGPVLDGDGNLYFGDTNSALRKIDPNGVITTVADFSGYGTSPNPNAGTINAITAGTEGQIYVATMDNRIRVVSRDGTVRPFAGNGQAAHSGDGGLAADASVDSPVGLAADRVGNVYIAESSYRIRRVSAQGTIDTVAGTGAFGYSAEYAGASTSSLAVLRALAAGSDGTIYFTEESQNAITIPFSRVRKITRDGKLLTVAGGSGVGHSKDGSLAAEARVGLISGLALDNHDNLYFSDVREQRIQRVAPSGVLTTVAGAQRFAGDGGPAERAILNLPTSVFADNSGNIYTGESWGLRIRKITPDLTISTLAGNGQFGDYGDGLPAEAASFSWLNDMARMPDGSLLVADFANNRVRRIDPSGIITTFAGTGQSGSSGDGGAAVNAQLTNPFGIAIDASGNVFISETFGHRIRKVTTDGKIATIAGNGRPGYSGDGGAASGAQLAAPRSMAFDSRGNLLIADSGNNRVRRISPDGGITTLAGNGKPGWTGDGGAATDASIAAPFGLAVDSSGAVLFTTAAGSRGGGIRRLRPDGAIDTLAGSLSAGATAGGACAEAARFELPSSIAVDSSGRIVVADRFNHRILLLTPAEGCSPAASTPE
jgi:sugar lactone lactonase YvrE